MATRIRILQVAIAVVNLVIFALAFTSLWPFPSGDFKLNLPESEDVEWSYDNGIVTVSAPYSIDNGGFYDVSDLTLSYRVTNYTSAHVYSDDVDLGTIAAGSVANYSIDFTFPLNDLSDASVLWLILNDDFLNFELEVSCYYTMRLVHFSAEYSVSVPWDALIQDVGVDDVTELDSQLSIDYHVITSSILWGETTTIVAQFWNGSSSLGQDADTVLLGTAHSGTFVFDLPFSSVPDRLVISIRIAGYDYIDTIPIEPGWLP